MLFSAGHYERGRFVKILSILYSTFHSALHLERSEE